ncbi:MAG TPA: sugar O-acetyltransferase [Limosilactobacillus coleohominis]|nr:sugar O-acetyltransferase [Limosilactobacillus coleohominis]
MSKQFTIVNMRTEREKLAPEIKRSAQLCFQINTTDPTSPRIKPLVKELFHGNVDDDASFMPPLHVLDGSKVKIGKNTHLNYNTTLMSSDRITIEDNVKIAANCQFLANNHDLYDREKLLCAPITIKNNAWLGAGVTVLAGVTIGENSVVGAGAVVTKDVAPNTIVAGVPAKVIKEISNPEKIKQG